MSGNVHALRTGFDRRVLTGLVPSAMVLILVLCGPLRVLPDEGARPDLCLRVRTERELGTLIRVLCRSASHEELKRLRSLSERSLALAAAWEQTRRSLVSDSSGPANTSDASLREFLRFVRLRLDADVPSQWADGILSAAVTSRESVTFAFGKSRHSPYKAIPAARVVAGRPAAMTGKVFPGSVAIVRSQDRPAIQIDDGRTILLPKEVIDHMQGAPYHLSVLASTDGAFVALHTYTWHPYRVLWIGRDNKSAPWQCEVWAAGNSWTTGGTGFCHWVTMVETDNELLVFGSSDISMYIEGFRKSDGTCVLRFGTFWGEQFAE